MMITTTEITTKTSIDVAHPDPHTSLHNKLTTGMIALAIAKSFDKDWHIGSLKNYPDFSLFLIGITGSKRGHPLRCKALQAVA